MLTVLHAGGKFDNNSYKVSGGLHGVGISVVNALSERLDLEIWRNEQVYQQCYERGKPVADLAITGTTKKRGTKVTFLPDSQIFETSEFSFDTLAQRLRELAFLNAGVTITLTDEREDNKNHHFHYDGGIVSFVEHLNKNKGLVNEKAIYMHGEREGIDAEIALQWNDGYNPQEYSFANNINTHEGGTHLSGFRSALTRTINSYAQRSNLTKDLKDANISGDDIREGMTAVISVKLRSPQFEGQTKTKLGNTEVKGIVEAIVNDKLGAFLEENPQVAKRVVSKSADARARVRQPAKPATWCGARARLMEAHCPANLPIARKPILRKPRSTSSKAIPPAGRQSRAAIAGSRRSCRFAARSSTLKRRASTRCWAVKRSKP